MYKISLILLLIAGSLFSQSRHKLSVDAAGEQYEASSSLKPGIFYFQYWLMQQNSIFGLVSHSKMYNSLRDQKFEGGIWKNSTGYSDLFNRMQSENFRAWLQQLYNYTDKVIVHINAMPYWLSSSKDTTRLNDRSWYKFMALPPADYTSWDATISAVADTIESWGFHPYYEIWNEPDGEYWQGSDAELLELYRHTALAIKKADPKAKVGGFGLQNWWRSAGPANSNLQKPYENIFFGKIRKEVAEKYSILISLMDSVNGEWKAQHVPLDFISYHYFRFNTNSLKYTAGLLRDKMLELGYCPKGTECKTGPPFPDLYVSEWQTTYGIQEKPFQPPLFLKILKTMAESDIEMNSIAAINDFEISGDDEFTGGWGLMSPGGFVKPVYKALLLLDDVISHGKMIDIKASGNTIAFASLGADTLRMILANYSMPVSWTSEYPKIGWSSFERLLYADDSKYVQPEFSLFKYTSIYWGNSPEGKFGTLDSVFFGLLQPNPITPTDMKDLLYKARMQWIEDSTSNANDHYFDLSLENSGQNLKAYVIHIDSTENNIIHLYDSLRTSASLSHNEAVDILKGKSIPCGFYGINTVVDTLGITGGHLSIPAKVNSVVYIMIPGITGHTGINETSAIKNNIKLYPNPAVDYLNLGLPDNLSPPIVYEIYSLTGNLLGSGNIIRNHSRLDISKLPEGLKLMIIRSGSRSYLLYFMKAQ